jgi:hypothetical protein
MSNKLLLHWVMCASQLCYSFEQDTFHRAKIAHELLPMPASPAELARAQSPAQRAPPEETAAEGKYRGHRSTCAENVAVIQDIHHLPAAEEGATQQLAHQVASVARDAKERAEEAQETEKTYEAGEAEEMEEEKSEHSNCTTNDPSTSRDSPPRSPPRVLSLHPEGLPATAALTATELNLGLMIHRETEAEEAETGGKLCTNVCVCVFQAYIKHEHACVHKETRPHTLCVCVCVCACVCVCVCACVCV